LIIVQNSFTGTLSSKFAMNQLLKIQPQPAMMPRCTTLWNI